MNATNNQRRIALIGFGEAGGILGAELAQVEGVTVCACDIKTAEPATAEAMTAKMADAGVALRETIAEAVAEADIVFSVVTASAARDVAVEAAGSLKPGQYFLDLNSVAPDTKLRASEIVDATGAHYVDVAVMAPVPPKRLQVPLLVGGDKGQEMTEILASLGCNARCVSTRVGYASAIKMCRSIMIKGLEALTTTCVLSARHYGVEEPVLASLNASFPSMGWDGELPHYLVSRVAEHGRRRAAEMREVAQTVADAGQNPGMPAMTAEIQDELIDRMTAAGIDYADPFDWAAFADNLKAAEST